MRRLSILLALVAFIVLVAPASAADALKTYKSRFTEKSYLSEREAVLRELAETGDAKALDALEWCLGEAKGTADDAFSDLLKVRKKLQPLLEELGEMERKYLEQQKKQGKTNVTKRPKWHIDDEIAEMRPGVLDAERRLNEWRDLVRLVKEQYGAAVTSLPAEVAAEVRADWESGRLVSRDWAERAVQWELVGGVQSPWATDMLVAAADAEPDPRVLVHVIDGLARRDPARVTPTLIAAMADVRWLVRTAAVTALAATPSKEGVDALVALYETGDGRTLDDAARALTALTGETFGSNGAQWRNWWATAREAWTGPPEPVAEEDAGAIPNADDAWKDGEEEADAGEKRRTGFFGIDTQSKRRVYVIDVSGSMAAPVGETTRAAAAKEELKRSILGLEDGALFNVVFFSDQVRIWKKEMVEADGDSRPAAAEYIDKMAVAGGTATYDALVAAFDLGDVGRGKKRGADPGGDARVDTIILLSDGLPSVGTLTNPVEIRTAIAERNAERRIAIHTVAFGKEADRDFMTGLAEDSGGTAVAK